MAGLKRVIVYTKSTIGVERGRLSCIEESNLIFESTLHTLLRSALHVLKSIGCEM